MFPSNSGTCSITEWGQTAQFLGVAIRDTARCFIFIIHLPLQRIVPDIFADS
jgi:hypothetical protein